MEKRLVTFLVVALIVMSANMMVMRWFQPEAPPAKKQPAAEENAVDAAAGKTADEPAIAADKLVDKPADAADVPADAQPKAPAVAKEIAEQRVTLGSLDPASGYRQLVTLVNAGAAVERIEMSSLDYLDQEDRSGYLGFLDLSFPPANLLGAVVRIVGAGTPAAEAGIKAGDLITEFNGETVDNPIALDDLLVESEPGDAFTITVLRDGLPQSLAGTLRRRPMQVIRPEGLDQLSFLLTMESIDGERIGKSAEELPGLSMRKGNWEVLPQQGADEAAFQYELVDRGLVVIKRFRLAKVDPADIDNPVAPAYHLQFSVEVKNVDDKPHKVAWRMDGPTGLPLEGAWYAMKISPNMRGGAGMRDVVVGFVANRQRNYGLVSATTIANDTDLTPWQDEPLAYLGVDGQYFAVALLPDENDAENYASAMPIRVGEVPADKSKINRTNVSFRLVGKAETVAPQGTTPTQSYRIFSGPKKPKLLAQYGLGNLVYYGWFGFVAEPMLAVLHFFYSVIPNYGIAIILLTVLVRSMMFPISRRQALNAQKMQELQPEIKKIQEKYKTNMEARSKAQQELFRKHKYNPLAGCLPVFLQLPIFMGLYRSLAVDVELRGAPLISQSIRWCSNLAAPDMLWNWSNFMPTMLAGQSGWLGPYFNVLPCLTIGLFIWQQKMFMPPPTDEQAAMQQKVMQYMMIFMGVMFFKVPSGLCLYFIASSLWGIAERKLLPKPAPPALGSTITVPARPVAARPGTNGNGAADAKKKKDRGRK